MKKVILNLSRFIIWIAGIFVIVKIYNTPSQPISVNSVIDDRYQEFTPLLYPGDVFSQTFRLPWDSLEEIAIAFSHESGQPENVQVFIQIYRDNALLIEQPLPLSACPDGDFINLNPGAEDWRSAPLTLRITNTSESAEAAFSLLATTDSTRYQRYTDGYTVNGSTQQGSIFCRFHYRTFLTDSDFYRKLTGMFLAFLTTLVLSGLIARLDAWMQQRTPHSPLKSQNRDAESHPPDTP